MPRLGADLLLRFFFFDLIILVCGEVSASIRGLEGS